MAQTIEPLPPGIMSDDAEISNSEQPLNGGPIDELLEDPGTPLENEAQNGAVTATDIGDFGDVVVDGDEDGGLGNVQVATADLGGDGEEVQQEEDEEDEDDDIEITIGDIKNNVTFRPGQAAGRGATGAKPTSKLDVDAMATLNGAPIFDADLNALEDKPWRKPGADITDYFNYGFTEETWLVYCDRQKRLRTEFGSAAQANKAYFSQPIAVHATQSTQQTPMPVPTLENRKIVTHTQPTQVINLMPQIQRQEQQSVVRTLVPAVPSALKPPPPAVPPQSKPATVLTPAVPAPVERVSLFENPSALYDSEPSSPGTPPPRPGSDNGDSSPPPVTPRSTMAPAMGIPTLTSASAISEINKMSSAIPPTSANFSVLNLSLPPPRVLPPTNLPPPMTRFGGPPPMFSSMPPPHFGNPPPTNIPPPGFGNPPPPGMPAHQFSSTPYGFPPPMRPQIQPPRFGVGGFGQQSNVSRAEAHSPASYSDRSSDDNDDRTDRFEPRFPPGSGGGPPGTSSRSKTEHRRSRSPYSSSRHGKYSSSSYGHGRSGHRSRSPVERDSDKERDRGSRRARDDEEGSKKKRSRHDESSSDKKKSKSSRGEESSRLSSKKRKRSKERKDDEKSSRH